jgi:hypothetical protein
MLPNEAVKASGTFLGVMKMRPHTFLLFVLIFSAMAVAQVSDEKEAQQALKGGEKVSTALATVTSTAISPLVGVCVMGAWQYYHTPQAQRDQLSFIQKPKFWIPIFLLLVLIFIKDTFGGFAPFIKKPLDAVEVLFVNHAALVLVAFPFVLNQVSRVLGFASWKGLFACLFNLPVVYAATPGSSVMHTGVSATTAALYTVVGLVVTCVVWLVGQAFDVMVLISPFPLLDLLLKAVRTAIFGLLAATALISPQLGLLLSLVIIIISVRLFGWALRLSFFGAMFAWNLLRLLTREEQVTIQPGARVPAFSARAGKLPQRTYGHLSLCDDGSLLFYYRHLLLGPQKTVALGRAEIFAVGRGVLFPTIIEPIESADRNQVRFRLLPTFHGVEESVRICLGMSEVRDLSWTSGLRAFWKFMIDETESIAGTKSLGANT